MFSSILVGSDLSPSSYCVVEYAKSLHQVGCRRVVLCYVIYVKHLVGLGDTIREEATPVLEAQKRELESAGLEVTVETPIGVPGIEITRLAAQSGCRAIVVGSHGHNLFRDILIGGVATDVVHRAERPVLVVRLEIDEQGQEPRCRVGSFEILSHVVYATDFSDNAERAFPYVEEFARSGCRKMTLLHVQDSSRIRPHLEHRLEEFNEIDRSRLERIALRLRELGVEQLRVEIPFGAPAKEIVDYVARESGSIVVMGTHGRGFIADIFAGSVAHNVVRLAQSPVLLVPSVQ